MPATAAPQPPEDFPRGYIEKPNIGLTEADLREMPDDKLVIYEQLIAAHMEEVGKNPLIDSYAHSQEQHDYLACQVFIGIATPGNQFGKSHANALLATINCVPIAYVPKHLRQYRTYQYDKPFACRIGVPTLDKHAEQIVLPILKKLVPIQALVGESWDKGWNGKKSQITFKNGSHIEFRSYNQETSDWAGSALDAILFDETPRKDLYEEGLRRFTTKPNAFMRFAMTPRGLPWVYHELYRQRNTNENIEVFGGSSFDNPYADRGMITKIISTSTNKAEVQQRLHGTFMSLEGRVLDDFQNSPMDDPVIPGHIVENITPKQLEGFAQGDIIIGIDPELRRPSACFIRCDNLREQALVFDEYMPQLAVMNVGVFCKGLLRRCHDWNITNPRFVIDPAAKASGINDGETILSEFGRNGIWPEIGNNNRELGIARMTALFANRQVGVTKRCTNFRDEADIWSWDEEAAERGESKAKKTKYAPNVLDSGRYGFMAIPWEPAAVFTEEPPPEGSLAEWLPPKKTQPDYNYL
jgi:phage terminase large subunit-like protein